MFKLPNFLTCVRDTYGGKWPRTLALSLLIIACCHIVSHFLLGVKWFDFKSIGKSFFVVSAFVVAGRYLNRKYPRKIF